MNKKISLDLLSVVVGSVLGIVITAAILFSLGSLYFAELSGKGLGGSVGYSIVSNDEGVSSIGGSSVGYSAVSDFNDHLQQSLTDIQSNIDNIRSLSSILSIPTGGGQSQITDVNGITGTVSSDNSVSPEIQPVDDTGMIYIGSDQAEKSNPVDDAGMVYTPTETTIKKEVGGFSLSDVKSVTYKSVDPSTAKADDEYTLYTITLKDGTKYSVKVPSGITSSTRDGLFAKAGYTGEVSSLLKKATSEKKSSLSNTSTGLISNFFGSGISGVARIGGVVSGGVISGVARIGGAVSGILGTVVGNVISG